MRGRHVVRRFLALTAARFKAATTVAANPGLRNLEIAWLTFNMAEYAYLVGLSVYAFDEGGAFAVGLVALIRTLPGVIIGPLAAVYADRLRRERVLRASLIGRLLASAIIAVALAADSPALIVYLLAALDAAAASMYWPAQTALSPELCRSAEELTAANAISGAMENLGTLAGPGAAALILALGSVTDVFFAGCVVLAAGLISTFRIRSDRVPPKHDGRVGLTEIAAGLRYLKGEADARMVVGLWTFESVLIGMSEVFVVVVAVDIAGMGDPGVGVLNGLIGLGGLIGSVTLASVARGHPFGRILGVAMVVLAAGLAVPGLASTAVIAASAYTVVGLAMAQVDVAAQSLLQRLVPEDKLGRVLGTFEGLYWGALGVGAMLASGLVVLAGPRAALIGVGVATAAVAVMARRRLATIDRNVVVSSRALELLDGVTMLATLPVPTLEHLARRLEPTEAAAGDEIIRQGDVGDRFYVIDEGTVEIVVDGAAIKTLGAGHYFGEIALLEDRPRMASVRAVDSVTTQSLDGELFVAAVTGHCRSVEAGTSVVVARLAESARLRRRLG
jgi:MFS family permease